MASSPIPRRVAIGSDHGGYHLKEALKDHLRKSGVAVVDVGANSPEPVDYPLFAHAVARRVASGQVDAGVVIDRAGIGSAMAANKIPGVRAALCYDLSSARNSREHNNANVLTLGAGLVGPDLAIQILDTWLATACTVERHLRRAAMIEPSPEAALPTGPQAAGASSSACSCHTKADMDLSQEDFEQIARRVAELSGGANPDAVCAFCQACEQTNPDFLRELLGAGAHRLGHRLGGGAIPADLAQYIDHTLLRPDATAAQIAQLCEEASAHGFASVCVNPTFVRLAAERLRHSRVRVCSVIGFPFGTHLPEVKADETRRAIRDGAREIDMVINIGALKGGDDGLSLRDIRAVTEACRDGRALCKVIIETAMLTDEEKIRACHLARKARANFVKTSTGYGGGGATAHDVALMAGAVCGTGIGVKASGGIRSFQDAQAMIRAGATRLGASAGVKIMAEATGSAVAADGGGKY